MFDGGGVGAVVRSLGAQTSVVLSGRALRGVAVVTVAARDRGASDASVVGVGVVGAGLAVELAETVRVSAFASEGEDHVGAGNLEGAESGSDSLEVSRGHAARLFEFGDAGVELVDAGLVVHHVLFHFVVEGIDDLAGRFDDVAVLLQRAQSFGVLELERGAGGGAGYEKGDHAGPHTKKQYEEVKTRSSCLDLESEA